MSIGESSWGELAVASGLDVFETPAITPNASPCLISVAPFTFIVDASFDETLIAVDAFAFIVPIDQRCCMSCADHDHRWPSKSSSDIVPLGFNILPVTDENMGGAEISSVEWSIEPIGAEDSAADEMLGESSINEDGSISVIVSGGTSGTFYKLSAIVFWENGMRLKFCGTLPVAEC